jgi:uncharacterized protein YdhG (YjbR/CyaY superfamily)
MGTKVSSVAEKFATVDEYIGSLPDEVQTIAEEIRRRARRAAPDADEVISYNFPTYKIGGRAGLYFAAWKTHIAIYPVPETDEDLERKLQPYRAVRSTLRFPLRQPMPYDLIERVFARHVAQRNSG